LEGDTNKSAFDNVSGPWRKLHYLILLGCRGEETGDTVQKTLGD